MTQEKDWVFQHVFNILGSFNMEEYVLKSWDLSFELASADEHVWFPLA